MPQTPNTRRNLIGAIIDRMEGKSEAPPLALVEATHIKITVGEIRELLMKNPTHPQAMVFGKATMNLPDDYEVAVEEADLRAIIENHSVIRRKENVNGQDVWRKTPGRELGPPLSDADAPAAFDPNAIPGSESPQLKGTEDEVSPTEDDLGHGNDLGHDAPH